MRLLLAALLMIQAAPAQSEADKLEAALKKFGDRSYKVLAYGGGTMTVKTRIEKEGEQKFAVLEVNNKMVGMKDGESLTRIEKCSLDRLQLVYAKGIRTTTSGDQIQWEVSVTGKKATAKANGKRRERTINITEGTVGVLGVERLICAAEQKAGVTFKVDVLDAGGGERFYPGRSLRCVGREDLEIQGKKTVAFKWEETSGEESTKEGDGRPAVVPPTYWVSPDGYLLQRADSLGVEYTLDSK